MIKIFGKIRYHWQPELSWSIIYWSIAIAPIFIGLSMLYERTEIPSRVFILFALFAFLVGVGFHRYFVIENNGILRVVSLKLFGPRKIEISKVTNREMREGTLKEALRGADIFVGVSAPGVLKPEWIKEMNEKPVIFAMANPTPEISLKVVPFARF